MKKIKRILSVFLISIFLSQSVVLPVFASETSPVIDKLSFWRSNVYNFFKETTGIIIAPFNGAIDSFYDWIQSHKSDYGISDSTTPEEFVINNYNIDESNNVSYSYQFINAMRDYGQNYVDTHGFIYCYSYAMTDFLQSFSSMDAYNEFKSIVQNNQNDYFIAFSPANKNICLYPWDSLVNMDGTVFPGRPDVLTYKDWSPSGYIIFYELQNNSYVKHELSSPTLIYFVLKTLQSNTPNLSYSRFYGINSSSTQYKVYMSVEDMKNGSVGLQSYYVTDSYNTEHTTDSFNTTVSNIQNSVNYQDVNNYVNNYYIQNTTYPSSQDVYNYINNYDGSGGGSGGDSGSGSDDDDDKWDWGWLTSIGDFIKGLFNALSAVVSGILDVLTSIIDLFIGTDNGDGTRTGGLPNIIGQLIAYFMPFLPSWVGTLIGFSIVLAVIIGVIRFLRK